MKNSWSQCQDKSARFPTCIWHDLFFFTRKNWKQRPDEILLLKKNPDIFINWKLLELLLHFIINIIICCFHLFIESLHCKIPVMFVKWKKRQQRKRLQNRPIRPFCFFVKFNACVVVMDTRVFNYKYRNIKQTSYGNRHFYRVAIVYTVGIHFCRRVVPCLPTRPTAPRQ